MVLNWLLRNQHVWSHYLKVGRMKNCMSNSQITLWFSSARIVQVHGWSLKRSSSPLHEIHRSAHNLDEIKESQVWGKHERAERSYAFVSWWSLGEGRFPSHLKRHWVHWSLMQPEVRITNLWPPCSLPDHCSNWFSLNNLIDIERVSLFLQIFLPWEVWMSLMLKIGNWIKNEPNDIVNRLRKIMFGYPRKSNVGIE